LYIHTSAIAYKYRLKRLASPTNDPLVGMYLKGLRRGEKNAQKKSKQAKPVTQDLLRRLNDFIYRGEPSLRMWRSVWRINVAFYCLLRWDDLKRLKVNAHINN
jgi:hypothetical protein